MNNSKRQIDLLLEQAQSRGIPRPVARLRYSKGQKLVLYRREGDEILVDLHFSEYNRSSPHVLKRYKYKRWIKLASVEVCDGI